MKYNVNRIEMIALTVFFLSSILSATYAQAARNGLHLAAKTMEHPNNVHSSDSKHKMRRHSSTILASAEFISNTTLDGKLVI